MDGLKLARAIRDRWPPIELIFTSGKHRLDEDEIPGRGKFLSRPYDTNALARAVKALTSP
jgi:hypothetical protein